MQISFVRKGMTRFDTSAFATKEDREVLYTIARLDLSHNLLTACDGLQILCNLTRVDISHNRLTSVAALPLKTTTHKIRVR